MKTMPSDVRLSILIPMRDEERFVGRCLDSVMAQLAGLSQCEVLCVDGASKDGTRRILEDYARRDRRVRIIDNPRRIVPAGMNLAIAQARGDVIVRLDCHAEYSPDYLASCLELLKRTGADNVGGYILTLPGSDSMTGRAIAAATSSKFGVGGSTFRTGDAGEREVDTVPFGCFRRDVFGRFGLYDERLARNQDIELNSRIRRNGGRIVISPGIRATYFNQSTLRGLARQAFGNGMWNAFTLYLVGTGLRWRHLAPWAFVGGLATLVCGGIWFAPLWILLGAVLLAYGLASGIMAFRAEPRGRTAWPLVMMSFWTLHIAYGVGTWAGFLAAPFRFGLSPLRKRTRCARRNTSMGSEVRPGLARLAKRVLDIAASASGLIVLGLPLLLIAVLIKATSRGPVLFKQRRVGRHGQLFTCVKFRTMCPGAEKQGSITTGVDRRITRVGRVLRRVKLDELPQLWNVLAGHMSLVGPRPDVPGYADRLEGSHRRILLIRPGITGPATLALSKEEEILAAVDDPGSFNDEVVYPLKVRLNLMYLDQWTFWKDVGFVVATIFPALSEKVGLDKRLGFVRVTAPEMAVEWLARIESPDADLPTS